MSAHVGVYELRLAGVAQGVTFHFGSSSKRSGHVSTGQYLKLQRPVQVWYHV